MKNFLYMFLFVILLSSCAQQNYIIQGTSSLYTLQGENNMAYICEPSSGENYIMLDSALIIHGRFEMQGAIDSARFVTLYVGYNRSFPIILEEGKININLANTSVSVEGTPLNERLYTFLATRDSLVYRIASLPMEMAQLHFSGFSIFEISEIQDSKEAELKIALDDLETRFVKDNYDNILGVTWFLEMCTRICEAYGFLVMTNRMREIYEGAPRYFKRNPQIDAFVKATRSY